MKQPIYFIPKGQPQLIEQLKGKSIALSVDSLEEMETILSFSHDNAIETIFFRSSKPLSELELTGIKFPIKIIVNETGKLNDVIQKAANLKEKNVRIYLSILSEEHYTQLLILSSLGIQCGIYFPDNTAINWTKLNELMSLNIYSLTNNPVIEPFNYMINQYDSDLYNDFDLGMLENNKMYLFFDKEEISSLFLTGNKRNIGKYSLLDNGEFEISTPVNNIDFASGMYNCAYCFGFKICTGHFKEVENAYPACRDFFSDLHEAIEYSIEKRDAINNDK